MKKIVSFCSALVLAAQVHAVPVSLFDGKSLDGWETTEADKKFWKVQDGTITGGSLTEKLGANTFLSTRKSYQNFELRFKVRMVKGEGFINSGVQVRSFREVGHPEMSGYQVDAGIGYWGDLYDEHRRNKKLTGPLDPKALAAVVKDWDEWNDYRVVCQGRRIQAWINGVQTLDYTERDSAIPLDGVIGIQAHGGGKLLAQYKDITIDELPAIPGAPSWKPAKETPPAQAANGSQAKNAADEAKAFHLPEGFVAELVASEEQGVGKPITVAWDGQGRMWTMTATEYPVDANENKASAEALYARGGKDKVLVFDDPSGPLPLKPRVFAEGLAIPLGILPDLDGNGALVHYGTQIRRYVDTNKDGKADKFDVVLDGFGIQDSHLMPHQFERAPGGWIYVAQGAFNASKVFRPNHQSFADGTTEKTYHACKLARFRPDGSAFELITSGPNNIWGLAQTRMGETFIQEANDMGYPIAECEPGTHYPRINQEKLRPYAPQLPKSLATGLGGTGLSGLAVAGDTNSRFASFYGGDPVVYVANPITNRIQVVSLGRNGDKHPDYYKREDFLVSDDPQFRPVAVRFGPDGFLYITDWYNKIISHNEVARNHPDRDKTRGRIWRIRPVDSKPQRPVNLTKMAGPELVSLLGGKSQGNAAMAWQWIAQSRSAAATPVLANLIMDAKQPIARRLDALWALEASGGLDATVFQKICADPSAEIRYQAVRAAGEVSLAPEQFVSIFRSYPDDANYRVRAALANAVRNHTKVSTEMVALVARLGRAPLTGGSEWDVYDREFERYLARWVMEIHRGETEKVLAQGDVLKGEVRLLAIQSLEPARGAALLVKELSKLSRPLVAEELALLGSQLGQPDVLAGMEAMLADPSKRVQLLENLSQLDPSTLANPALAKLVSKTCQDLLAQNASANRPLVLRMVKLMRLPDFEPTVAGWITSDASAADLKTSLEALREIGSKRVDLFTGLLGHQEEGVRRAAVGAMAFANDPQVVAKLADQWGKLPGALRSIAVDGLTSSKEKAREFAKLLAAGKFEGVDGGAYEKLIAVLGESDPAMVDLLSKTQGLFAKVIQLPSKKKVQIGRPIDLDGAFTVETWIRLAPGISNADNLLGAPGGADFNFFDQKLRVFGGAGVGDLIVSNRKIEASTWIHCAVTRDASGKFCIYLDGELDQDKGRAFAGPMKKLMIGETSNGQVTAAQYMEFRVWDVARSEDEIRANYRTDLAGQKPDHLVMRVSGDSPGSLDALPAVATTMDFPKLVTAEEAATTAAKFARYRAMAEKQGDAAAGQLVFQGTCMMCHQVKGQGMKIGPDLSGAGAMGMEALLRNILEPNAQLESGYYRHDITLTDNSMVSGFMVEESKDAITLRPIGAEPKVIERSRIANHTVSKRSLMPEGLMDGLSEKQVSDLFGYLMTLK